MNKSLLVEKIMHPDVLKSIKKSVSRLAAKPENRGGRIPCEYCRANEKFENEHEVLEHIKSMHPIQCPGKVENILEQRVDYFSPPSIFVKIQIKGAKITLQSQEADPSINFCFQLLMKLIQSQT